MIYKAIVFLPLIGALIAGFFGRSIGHKASEYLTATLVVISALLSWVAFTQVGIGGQDVNTITLLRWITVGDLNVNWSLRIDTLTVVMLVVVNSVSALVHIYSIGYMSHDAHRSRFFAYLSLFTFAMLMLVTSDNLLQLFFGWEGVGLASYLLIGFWYEKPSANAAAIKAFVVNRVGDFGFALGIFGVYLLFGTINLEQIFAAAPEKASAVMHFLSWDFNALTIITLLLFMGAMGKSAQFLLHTWLPDAMEGPTPVSALIHAATMVTAGVFMVARLSPLFEQAPLTLQFVTFIGASTAFFAATVGVTQNDIKRVVAYSTCSQLGYMFVALGVGAYGVAVFHLFTHAFFKALLFLGSGSVIHAVSNEQDLRKMGNLWRKIPMTWAMMMVGTLALTGFPLTAGYFSKDAVIEVAYASHTQVGMYAFWMTVIAAFLTSFYSWRLMFMAFYGKSRVEPEAAKHIHESPYVMLVPLFLLATGALLAGLVFKGYFIGADYTAFWRSSLAINHDIMHHMHDVPAWVKYSPFVMMVSGFILAVLCYLVWPSIPGKIANSFLFNPVYKFLLNKWYIDELYDILFVRPAFWIGRFLWKTGDGKIINGYGPDGLAARVLDVTKGTVKMQTGYLYHYAFAMLIGLAALITWLMFMTGGMQ